MITTNSIVLHSLTFSWEQIAYCRFGSHMLLCKLGNPEVDSSKPFGPAGYKNGRKKRQQRTTSEGELFFAVMMPDKNGFPFCVYFPGGGFAAFQMVVVLFDELQDSQCCNDQQQENKSRSFFHKWF